MRGFDLPALAGPASETDQSWAERPADDLAGVAKAVDSSASLALAEDLVRQLGEAVDVAQNGLLEDRLEAVATAITAKGSKSFQISAANGPAITGCNWSLMQEMGVREASTALRNEYGTRRHILLRRLDLCVQVLCGSEKSKQAANQRKITDLLSSMWAGWRKNAAEAPPLSEWSALASTRGLLARSVNARISGPNARGKSAVKSIKIGPVPNRGGIPEGYKKSEGESEAAKPKAAEQAAAGSKPQRAGKSFIAESVEAGKTKADESATKASSSEGVDENAGSSAASSKDDTPASVSEKPQHQKEQQTADGARSTNLELAHEDQAQKRKDREEGKTNVYYQGLIERRGQGESS